MTRESLAKKIATLIKTKNKRAYHYVDRVIKIITNGLKEERKVKIRLFGTLSIHHKKARMGRNPKTKEDAVIKARRVVQFNISPTLRKRVNDKEITLEPLK